MMNKLQIDPAKFKRLCSWSLMISVLALASVGSSYGFHHKGLQEGPSGRLSTEPPMAPTGKLGQDLFLAVDHGDLTRLKALLKQGADPNSRNGLEFTPVFIAGAAHQLPAMQALLDAGANINANSPYGTPIMFCVATAHQEGFDLLVKKGADIHVRRADGMDLLMMAANTGYPPIVAQLLKMGVKPDLTDESGCTALSLAALHGNVSVVQMLLGAGSDINHFTKQHESPLMLAAKSGHPEVVELLLKSGADKSLQDGNGRTALLLATAYGDNPKVVRALIAAGADPMTKDSFGKTAWDYAFQRGHHEALVALGPKPAINFEKATKDPVRAVRLSLHALQDSMLAFHDRTACVSCHHEGLARMATGDAMDHGFKINPLLQKVQIKEIYGMLNGMKPLHLMALKDPNMMKQVPLMEINEIATTDSWLLAGMSAQKQAPCEGSAAMALVLAKSQLPDGSWRFSGPREPMQSSNFTFTALSAKSIHDFAPASAKLEIKNRIANARHWLAVNKPMNSEDRAFRLLGLKWCGAPSYMIKSAANAILKDQLPDGGWAQLPHMTSDAYATGQAIYALRVAGRVSASEPAIRRGVSYLLNNQEVDGTWYVEKRASPGNNYVDAKFPYGYSQYASFNGTCWAMMAILETEAMHKVAVHSARRSQIAFHPVTIRLDRESIRGAERTN